MNRVCVIGAGSSGIASCQVLKSRGLPFDCFEKGSEVGGNWRYDNDNGMSSAYQSLHINTSRNLMAYRSFPMPADYPDYPHHTQIARYFDDYVDHFGLREHITFRTEVTLVEPAPGGGWEVTTDDGATRRYGAVLVANGHHWNPRWPEFPGTFDGDVTHAHHYRTADAYVDKNVLVLGIGNSAVDIAVETSRVARMTYLAMRRGAHVIPKYVKGRPTDELSSRMLRKLPFPVQRKLFELQLKSIQGKMTDYGLPEPDHRLGEAHPTVSAELLGRLGHGRITPKPNIGRLQGDRVRFTDGSVEPIDAIVYCTGYQITFPFLPDSVMKVEDNRVSLYKRVVAPGLPGLFFIGLLQPLGAIMPLAEAQSEWVADLLEGKGTLPSVDDMRAAIAKDEAALRKRYVGSPRHTIQVDFWPYLEDLERERKRARRYRRGVPVTLERADHEPVGV